ncbi:aldehyde dehydrogenase family protein [Thermobifida halotolerans]|uniref:Aldehyde dehydrogenase family protein n=1 Tax=Thermobifida halotolerans TaxID=483545 RepID=A0AA97LVT5_9ACTN|nr:aldehyde dehydrogenase family protein [Thermobifida halotolerans]UOE18831.1 aldehyde dehydrogenase family protein [Thermobifida halotolerans]
MTEFTGDPATRATVAASPDGASARSAPGDSYPVTSSDGTPLGHVPRASQEDAHEAVRAARTAFGGWAEHAADRRARSLVRVAEALRDRHARLVQEVVDADGVAPDLAERLVTTAADRWTHYADRIIGGACDGKAPVGVVAIVAPPFGPLLGLVSLLAPVVAGGNTAVVVASERAPLPALTLAEALAEAELPDGVVGILTGRTAELAPLLTAHADVDAVDLTGAGESAAALASDSTAAAKRVLRPEGRVDWFADPGTARVTAFLREAAS